jgi:putative hydrolase of the HAD superfamily
MIRAVIFDLGHTIWDIGPDTTRLLDAAYVEFHAQLIAEGYGPLPDAGSIKRAVTAELAKDAESYFANGAELSQPPTHTWVARALRELGLTLDDVVVERLTPPLFATEVDRLIVGEGTIEAVVGLAESGMRLGCITNTLAATAAIHEMLARHGIRDVMDVVVVSTEQGIRKPHPRLFDLALSGVRCAAHDAVFVGDSPYHDIAAAKAVGMKAVQTTQYVTRPPVEGTPPPDATIAHLRELLPLIEVWNRAGEG